MDGAGPGDTQTIGHWSNISGQICIFISVLRLFYFYLHYRKIEDISLFVWKMRVDIAGNILFYTPFAINYPEREQFISVVNMYNKRITRSDIQYSLV